MGWTSDGTLYSASDDKTIRRSGLDSSTEVKNVLELDVAPTDLKWCITSRSGMSEETFVVGCSDGTIKFYQRNGRLDRSVAAHEGAVTCLAWSQDGTSLLSGGEDGVVKNWSGQGNLRSKLWQSKAPVYSICWSPDQHSVLICTGSDMVIKPVLGSSTPSAWKAHDGAVLQAHWSPMNDLIVSGGEDCVYKVWDSLGRLLFSSAPGDFPVTSVRWSPCGSHFVTGSYDSLTLADKAGWSHGRVGCKTGSVYALDWSPDGTSVAVAGANGTVMHACVVEKRIESANMEVLLHDERVVRIRDIAQLDNTPDELEYGGRVVEMSVGHGHVIVATTGTVYVYPFKAIATPFLVEVKAPVTTVVQSTQNFALVDPIGGLRVLQYDGKLLSTPRFQGFRPELISKAMLALSPDVVAVIDPVQRNKVHIFDASSGRALGNPLVHDLEVIEIAVSQTGLSTDRKITFIDRNRDIFLAQAMNPVHVIKLASMVDSAAWHDTQDALIVLKDGWHVTFTCPNAFFVDRDIAAYTKISTECASSIGKRPHITSVSESRINVRRSDGAQTILYHSPIVAHVSTLAQTGQWAAAVRLCRSQRDNAMWACVATYAITAQQVDVAEVACAALDEVDKLEFMQNVRNLPSPQARAAELLLFSKQPDEAERVLLQAGLIYRAIEMNTRLFRWARALAIAESNKSCVDIALLHRKRFLSAFGQQETLSAYAALAGSFDASTAAAREAAEIEKEKRNGRPYVGVLLPVGNTAGGSGSMSSSSSLSTSSSVGASSSPFDTVTY